MRGFGGGGGVFSRGGSGGGGGVGCWAKRLDLPRSMAGVSGGGAANDWTLDMTGRPPERCWVFSCGGLAAVEKLMLLGKTKLGTDRLR